MVLQRNKVQKNRSNFRMGLILKRTYVSEFPIPPHLQHTSHAMEVAFLVYEEIQVTDNILFKRVIKDRDNTKGDSNVDKLFNILLASPECEKHEVYKTMIEERNT